MTLALVLLLAFFAFLAVLGVSSVAVAKGAGASGSKAGGCLGGCGLALAFVFLGGAGIAGLGAFVAALVVGTAIEANPIRKIEIRRGPEVAEGASEEASSAGVLDGTPAELGAAGDPDAPVHLLFTVEGPIGSELATLVARAGGVDPEEMEDFLTIHRRASTDGSELSIYDFCLPLRGRDLDQLEEDIRRDLDGLVVRLPTSVTIHFEGAERLY